MSYRYGNRDRIHRARGSTSLRAEKFGKSFISHLLAESDRSFKLSPLDRLPDGVVFDLDGTLLDTETLARDLFIRACLEIGCECKIEVYEETIGLNVRQAHALFFDRLGSDYPYVEIRQLTSKWFSERINESPVATKQGSLTLLDTLASLNIKIGLCTSTGRKSVEICLDQLDFSRYFSEMVCGGESEEGKPHPSPYLNIARKMSIKPSNSWAVEDSRNGVRSAFSAGYQVLHVPDHNSLSHDMSDMGVTTYASLTDIAREVKQIGA